MSHNIPPVFPDADKFDGTNWVFWHGLIEIAADLRGISGYLDGTISQPSDNPPTIVITSPDTQNTTTPVLTNTPWDSPNPSPAEWKTHNAWAKGLLIYNTKDPIGLGIILSGTAADAWKSYKDQYAKVSEIAILNVERDLQEITYSDNHDFIEHITRLRTKWATATALAAQVDDKTFQIIVLSSLPCFWDPIVSTLYNTSASREAIAILMTHLSRISKDGVVNPQNATTALQFTANNNNHSRNGMKNQHLLCTNPNCGRRGHLITNCYWQGGGKAGQFPTWFGKKGGSKGNAPNSNGGNSNTSANSVSVATTSNQNSEPQVFALSLITMHTCQVSTIDPMISNNSPNEHLKSD